jgi:protein-tyrosine phosphatase
MAEILVVCSGNICRSPIAEGLLRRALERRAGKDAPGVSSAGTIAVDGGLATAASIVAAGELGIDIGGHRARRLSAPLAAADLIVCMAAEHRDAIAALAPSAADRTFTLKELVRLLERAPLAVDAPSPSLAARIAEAARLRATGGSPNPFDEDVVDPLGMSADTYRAVAWELDRWIDRLVVALYGEVAVAAEGG